MSSNFSLPSKGSEPGPIQGPLGPGPAKPSSGGSAVPAATTPVGTPKAQKEGGFRSVTPGQIQTYINQLKIEYLKHYSSGEAVLFGHTKARPKEVIKEKYTAIFDQIITKIGDLKVELAAIKDKDSPGAEDLREAIEDWEEILLVSGNANRIKHLLPAGKTSLDALFDAEASDAEKIFKLYEGKLTRLQKKEAALSERSKHVDDKFKTIEKFETEITSLKQKLQEAEGKWAQAAQGKKELDAFNAEKRKLNENTKLFNEKLAAHNKELSGLSAERIALANQIKPLRTELQQFSKEAPLDVSRQRMLADKQKQLASYEKEYASLNAKIAALEKQQFPLKEQLGVLKRASNDLAEKQKSLANILLFEKLEKPSAILQKIADTTKLLIESRKDLGKLKSEREFYTKQLKNIREDLAILKRKVNDNVIIGGASDSLNPLKPNEGMVREWHWNPGITYKWNPILSFKPFKFQLFEHFNIQFIHRPYKDVRYQSLYDGILNLIRKTDVTLAARDVNVRELLLNRFVEPLVRETAPDAAKSQVEMRELRQPKHKPVEAHEISNVDQEARLKKAVEAYKDLVKQKKADLTEGLIADINEIAEYDLSSEIPFDRRIADYLVDINNLSSDLQNKIARNKGVIPREVFGEVAKLQTLSRQVDALCGTERWEKPKKGEKGKSAAPLISEMQKLRDDIAKKKESDFPLSKRWSERKKLLTALDEQIDALTKRRVCSKTEADLVSQFTTLAKEIAARLDVNTTSPTLLSRLIKIAKKIAAIFDSDAPLKRATAKDVNKEALRIAKRNLAEIEGKLDTSREINPHRELGQIDFVTYTEATQGRPNPFLKKLEERREKLASKLENYSGQITSDRYKEIQNKLSEAVEREDAFKSVSANLHKLIQLLTPPPPT